MPYPAKSSKRLLYLALCDQSMAPYQELALPALAASGWEITVVAVNATQSLLHRVLPYRSQRIDLPRQPGSAALSVVRRLLAARLTGYDVIYVATQAAVTRAWPALWGARRVVYHNLDYYDPVRYPIRCWFEKRLAHSAALHINADVHRALMVRAQYRLRCPILVFPPVLPSAWPVPERQETLRRQLAGRSDAFVLALHGGFSRERMTAELFEALAQLPDQFRLVMSHCGELQDTVRGKLQALGILDRVTFRPGAGFQEMLAHSVNCDAGILLYKNTDAGNYFQAPGRLTEYLACGLPVLTNNFAGLEHLTLKYGIGETVDARAPSAIAEGILRLEGRVRQTPASHFREQFLKHFAAEHWYGQIQEAFESVAGGRSDRAGDNVPHPWWSAPEAGTVRPGAHK